MGSDEQFLPMEPPYGHQLLLNLWLHYHIWSGVVLLIVAAVVAWHLREFWMGLPHDAVRLGWRTILLPFAAYDEEG
jgi:hypothetical protein